VKKKLFITIIFLTLVIGCIVIFNAEQDACAKTLLNNAKILNKPVKADYIGSWYEPTACRVFVKITDMGKYIQVLRQGSCSAYTRSEDLYTCQYKSDNGNLICRGALHTEITSSRNGIVYEDDPEKYLECELNNPNSMPKEIKRCSKDNVVRIISVEKGDCQYSVISEVVKTCLSYYEDKPKLKNMVLRIKDGNHFDYEFYRNED